MHESDEKCRSQLFDDHSKEYLHELGSKNIAPRINAFLRFELYCVRELFNLLPVPERLLPISKILHHVQTGDESLAEELLGMFFQCIGISEPQKLSNFYAKFLFIPAVAENPYNFKQFSSKVVPHNWILEPLNVLYHSKTSESQLKPQITEALMEVVKKGVETTLGFVIFCLKNCDGVLISSSMDIPALYTRIVLVFMMGKVSEIILFVTACQALRIPSFCMLRKSIISGAQNPNPIEGSLEPSHFEQDLEQSYKQANFF